MLVGAVETSAQVNSAPAAPAMGRGFINLNAGSQAKSIREDGSFDFSLYEETGTARYTREVKGGAFPDVMTGVRIKQNFGLAIQASMRNANADSPTTASIPDPLAYESPRVVTGTLAGLIHKELWISLLPVYAIPVTSKLDVTLFAGPALVKVDHETVSLPASGVAEPGPTVSFTRTTQSRSVWGYSAGADVRFMFNTSVGIGAFARIQQATVNLPGTGLSIDSGGPQFGGGLRFRF